MTEAESPKNRPFWQMHLSTAVLLSLVAGGMMWGQLRKDCLDGGVYSQGWPFGVMTQNGEFVRAGEAWIVIAFNIIFCLGLILGIALLLETIAISRESRKP